MTNYIVDKEKMREILLGHKAFIARKCQELSKAGIDITKLTYRQTDKFTDEFIDIVIAALPVDSLLDEVDKVMKKTVGYTSREMMDRKEHKEKGGEWDE